MQDSSTIREIKFKNFYEPNFTYRKCNDKAKIPILLVSPNSWPFPTKFYGLSISTVIVHGIENTVIHLHKPEIMSTKTKMFDVILTENYV